MSVSQAVRDTLLTIVCMALMLLTAVGQWLMSEQDRRKMEAYMKERNHD